MQTVKMLALVGLVLALTACGPVDSLNPLFTERDLVFDPALVGTWRMKAEGNDERLTVVIKRSANKSYEVTEPGAENESSKAEAHLLRLGTFLFLDVADLSQENRSPYDSHITQLTSQHDEEANCENRLLHVGSLFSLQPAPDAPQGPKGAYQIRLISQTHQFYKYAREGKNLHVTWINDDSIEMMINNGKVALSYQRVGRDSVLLTASTQRLQRFVLEHAQDDEVFSKENEMVFKRVR